MLSKGCLTHLCILFLCLVTSLHGLNQTAPLPSLMKRVINGENVPPHSFQWAASLRGVLPKTNEAILCGASFITNEWLITAAHCFGEATKNGDTMTNPKYWEIKAGTVFQDVTSEDVKNEKNKVRRLNDVRKSAHNMGSKNVMSILSSLFDGNFDGIDEMSKDRANTGHEEKGILAYPDKIVLHPHFKTGKLEWDIALVHLTDALTTAEHSQINLINLPPTRDSPNFTGPLPMPGEECAFVGWGCKQLDGKPAQRAQLARLRVMNHETCDFIFKYSAGLNRYHEFCAGYFKRNIGICQGDSGSGLACNRDGKWYLAGVASATHAAKPSKYPGLFTRVSYFDNWIRKVIEESD